MTTYADLKPGQHWISVTSGMSGYFAVELWLNNEDPTMVFPEPYDTGCGRYATHEQAVAEAKEWAEAENLPYLP